MSSKVLLQLILLILCSAVLAQQPKIDHLEIDNASGRLRIFGSFGATPGLVTVDSLNVLYQSWSADTIVCILNDTGAGSCGAVQVTTPSGISEERLLSEWNLNDRVWQQAGHMVRTIYFSSIVRLDLLWAIGLKDSLLLNTCSSSSFEDTVEYDAYPKQSGSDKKGFGSRQISFQPQKRLFRIDPYITYTQNGYSIDFPYPMSLDTNFIPQKNSYSGMMYQGFIQTNDYGIAKYLPSDSALHAYRASVASQRFDDVTLLAGSNFIVIASSDALPHSIEIFDECGRMIVTGLIETGDHAQRFSVHPGLYFVRVGAHVSKILVR